GRVHRQGPVQGRGCLEGRDCRGREGRRFGRSAGRQGPGRARRCQEGHGQGEEGLILIAVPFPRGTAKEIGQGFDKRRTAPYMTGTAGGGRRSSQGKKVRWHHAPTISRAI